PQQGGEGGGMHPARPACCRDHPGTGTPPPGGAYLHVHRLCIHQEKGQFGGDGWTTTAGPHDLWPVHLIGPVLALSKPLPIRCRKPACPAAYGGHTKRPVL